MMAIKGQKRKHRSKPPAFNDIMIDDVIHFYPDLTTHNIEQILQPCFLLTIGAQCDLSSPFCPREFLICFTF